MSILKSNEQLRWQLFEAIELLQSQGLIEPKEARQLMIGARNITKREK